MIGLSHLPAIDGDHIVMDPVAYGSHMIANGALCYLTFMVRKLEVHASAMNIKLGTQVFCCHSRTFNMPARETYTPGRFPAHDMLRRCIFPKGKISAVPFFLLSFQVPGVFKKVINHAAAELAIIM